MKFLVVPLLVAVFGQAGEDAAKLMKAMEDKIAKAESIQVTYDAVIKGTKLDKIDGTVKGSLALAEGSKMRLEINASLMDGEVNLELVSDGNKMVTRSKGVNQKTEDTPKRLRSMIISLLARTGVTGNMLAASYSDKNDPLDVTQLSDFKKIKSEKVGDRSAEVIEYKISIKDQKATIIGNVWLDRETNLPLKRVLRGEFGGDNVTITEIYGNFRINSKIEGNPFELPK